MSPNYKRASNDDSIKAEIQSRTRGCDTMKKTQRSQCAEVQDLSVRFMNQAGRRNAQVSYCWRDQHAYRINPQKSERMHKNFKQYYQPADLTYLHSGDTNRALKSARTLPRYSKSQNKP